MTTLDAPRLLADVLPLEGLPADLFLAADATVLGQVRVLDQSAVQTAFGTLFEATLAADQELSFTIPALPVSLVAAAGTPNGTFRLRAALEEDWFVELDRLRLALRFDPLVLRPLDPAEPYAEIRAESGLRLTAERLELTDPGLRLSLPPSEIPGTGIAVALEGILLHLGVDTLPPEIAGVEDDEGFQGVYAERALLRLLPMIDFGGFRGISLEARDLVVATSGVSFTIQQEFDLDHDDTAIGAGSEAAGILAGAAWPIALRSIEAHVLDNEPRFLSARGVVGVPFFDLLFDAEVALRSRAAGDGFDYLARVSSRGAGRIATPFGSVTYEDAVLEGRFADDDVALSGAVAGLRVDLDPFVLSVGGATLDVTHASDLDQARVHLSDVQMGPLGTLDLVDLVVEDRRTDAGTVRDVRLETELSWEDLSSRIQAPASLPAPPASGSVRAVLRWVDDSATGQQNLVLGLAVAVEDLDALWSFVPAGARPSVRNARLTLDVRYDSAASFDGASTDGSLAGAFGVEMEVRLPDLGALPGSDLFAIHTGNADGWIGVRLSAGVDAQGNAALSLAAHQPLSVDIQLPGLPQPVAPIHLALTDVAFDVQAGAAAQGALTLAGAFELRPIEPPASAPLAEHLRQLLAPIQPGVLSGTATLALAFRGDRAQLTLDCDFANASVDVDVFALLANLASGRGEPAGVRAPAGEVALGFPVGFSVRRLGLQVGTLDQTVGAAQAAIELNLAVHVAGLTVDGHVRLSDQELAIGLTRLEVPLQLPRFPVSQADLARLRTDAAWSQELATLAQQIAARAGQPGASADRVLADLRARHAVLSALQAIRQQMSGPANVQTYQASIEMVAGILDAATGVTHAASDLKLVLSDVEFHFPFADPRNIGLAGSAHLEGFDPNDPFKALENLRLGLGISAERIYFSADTLGQPIPLPDFGRYPGGSVSLTRFTLGYGYTRNSFSMTFDGALVLPPQLVEDADTSRELGAGIRLPTHSQLGFKLDLIPVPGPVPVVPMFEFDLDLRAPGSAGIARTDVCEPAWDGLQFVVPDVFHAGFKHLALAPFLGVLPIPNVRFGGDVALGDDHNGLTVVADDVLYLLGVGTPPTPIPYLADPTQPFFRHLCVNVRLAGFGVNFNLERPFPSLSPMALFEVLGLLADPMMPIDPDGPLANSVRVSLTDAQITLPQEVLALFPDASAYTRKPLDVTINLGTFVAALQAGARTTSEVFDAIENGTQGLARRLDDLTRTPPRLDFGALLDALPPDLRKVRLGGSFAGFEARAVIVLADASDAAGLAAIFARRGRTPAAGPPPALPIGMSPDPAVLRGVRPNVRRRRGDPRTVEPDAPENNVFAGIEFESFDAADLAAIPPPRTPSAGVVVAAHVKVFAGQRYRFLGFLFEDGSFGLVSALDVQPLALQVAGLIVRCPLRVQGRLILAGRARRDGGYGALHAEGRVVGWNVVPGALRLDIGKAAPATLDLTSDGHFALAGDVVATFFNGAAVLRGAVDVSHTHCFAEGEFHYQAGEVDLRLAARGRVGPGPRFEFAGAGTLDIAGNRLLDVQGVVGDRYARVSGKLETSAWQTPGGPLPCSLKLEASGTIDLRRRLHPSYALEGSATLRVLDAGISGRGGVGRTTSGKTYAFAEGALAWQGREWLNGRIELSNQGIQIAGRTSLTLEITPSNFATVQVANLFFKLDLEGAFTLDVNGGLRSFARVKGDWQLAIQLPGGNPRQRQSFPIAMQRFDIGGGIALNTKLLEIRTLRLLPSGFQLPPMSITPTGFVTIRTHDHGVSIPAVGGLTVLIPELDGFHDPDRPDPFPFPSRSDQKKGWRTVASVPTSFSLDGGQGAIQLPTSFNFDLHLVWDAAAGRFALDLRPV